MISEISAEVKKCKKLLLNGSTILYPTDTVWGIGCDATNYEAVKKIYKIKKRSDSKALICLVSDIEMLKHYVEYIPDVAFQLIKFSEKPTTIIYDKPKNISENLISDDNTIGFRVVNDDFCKKLITKINKPIVSTSANISGNPTPNSFKEIETDILKGVDYVVNLDLERKCTIPSTIIKLGNNGVVKIIR